MANVIYCSCINSMFTCILLKGSLRKSILYLLNLSHGDMNWMMFKLLVHVQFSRSGFRLQICYKLKIVTGRQKCFKKYLWFRIDFYGLAFVVRRALTFSSQELLTNS